MNLQTNIEGWRPWLYSPRNGSDRFGGPKSMVTADCARAAVAAVDEVLSDNQWHRKARVTEMRMRFGVSLPGIMSALDDYGIAESDDGRWVCVPGKNTPELAPGETA